MAIAALRILFRITATAENTQKKAEPANPGLRAADFKNGHYRNQCPCAGGKLGNIPTTNQSFDTLGDSRNGVLGIPAYRSLAWDVYATSAPDEKLVD